MNDIETYKTITLKHTIAANSSSFTKEINCEFIPDEIILKNCSLWSSAAYDKAIAISTDLIFDTDLLTIPKTSSFHESYNVPFRNHRPINGTYTFTIKDFDNVLISKVSTTYIAFTLVFIKWKPKDLKPITIVNGHSNEEDK
jgi:hypothetical protein